MIELPVTIDNGTGERLTFTHLVPTPRGGRLEGETRVAPGAGPPMHVHFLQDEGFTVLAGRIGTQRPGEPPVFAEAGASIVFPAGVPHKFWNAGDTELRCAAWVEPPGNVVYLLSHLFASQRRNGGARPALLDVAYLMRRYRTEFAMLEIPAIVQRLVFPIVVAIGTMLGAYRKYADAPPPDRGHRTPG